MKVLYDLFPARILVIPPGEDGAPYEHPRGNDELTVTSAVPHGRRVDAVRVIVTDEMILIAGDSPTGPVLIFRERYDKATLDLQKLRKKISRLTTVQGKIVLLQKDENCGCGSRLRTWNPYGTVNSSKDPTE